MVNNQLEEMQCTSVFPARYLPLWLGVVKCLGNLKNEDFDLDVNLESYGRVLRIIPTLPNTITSICRNTTVYAFPDECLTSDALSLINLTNLGIRKCALKLGAYFSPYLE